MGSNNYHKLISDWQQTQDTKNKAPTLTPACVLMGVTLSLCFIPKALSYIDHAFYHHVFNLLLTANPLLNPIIYLAFLTRRKRNAKKIDCDDQCDVKVLELNELSNESLLKF